jgi:hypothetical protein
MYIDFANKNKNEFDGFVGGQQSSLPNIEITTKGNVDTGSGFANIKPIKDGSLTDLLFTPENDQLFGDFSFRAQLVSAGDILLKLIDDDGVAQDFLFAGTTSNKDADQKRMGILSTDGESIRSVELISGFKEVKQIEFSPASGIDPRDTSPVPIPAALPLFAGAIGGLGVVGRWRRRRTSATLAA